MERSINDSLWLPMLQVVDRWWRSVCSVVHRLRRWCRLLCVAAVNVSQLCLCTVVALCVYSCVLSCVWVWVQTNSALYFNYY